MSSSLPRDIPEELLDIISELIIHEDKYKKEQIADDFSYEYAYDYVDSVYVDIEKPKDESPTIIKISL